MRNSVLLLGFIFMLLMPSCGFKEKHEAVEFYNKITNINDTLFRMTTAWHDTLDRAVLKKNYSNLPAPRTDLGAFISRSRAMLGDMVPTPENEKLKDAEESLLEARAQRVADIYPVFEPLSELTPKETVAKNLALIRGDVDSEKAGIDTVKRFLKVYAEKYRMKK